MSTHPLTRQTHRPPPALSLAEGLDLPLMRCHELCGPSRRTLALMLAARTQGPVMWIRPAWGRTQPLARGIVGYINPGRLILVEPLRLEDILWCMEEALRAGCVPLVVAECAKPPAMTPVRRLHLAAETGGKEGKVQPMALILTPGDGGAPGVESRWHLAPRHTGEDTAWMLQRRRARMAPPAAWVLRWRKGVAQIAPVGEIVAAE